MVKVIIYPDIGGGVAVVSPAPNCGLTIEEIAERTVPAGLPHKIIDSSELPQDRTFRDAWEYVE